MLMSRRRRLYFLLPDVQRARTVVKELLLARIEERYIHVLARDGIALGDLPEATLLQKSDAVHATGLGLVVGGATGAAAGILVMLFPPTGFAMGLSVVLAMALLGGVMGIWVSGMIGSSTPNTHLETFQDDIERGKILMIVDVPSDKAEEISRMIQNQHPEADMRGFDPTIPSFP